MPARRSTAALVRSSVPTVRIAVPRAPAPMTHGRAAKRLARRAGKRAAASGALAPMTAALVSAGIGYAEKSGMLSMLPSVPAIGRKGTLALAAFAWQRFAGGGKLARDIAIVSAALAGYELGKTGTVSGDDYEGEF